MLFRSEAINQTCFQRGAKGAMEVILHSDPTEGQKVYDRVQAGQVPLSDCNKPDLFGSRYLADTVAAACEPAQSSAPIPATAAITPSTTGRGWRRSTSVRTAGHSRRASRAYPRPRRSADSRCGRLGVRAHQAAVTSERLLGDSPSQTDRKSVG